jgi:hypothetical protein
MFIRPVCYWLLFSLLLSRTASYATHSCIPENFPWDVRCFALQVTAVASVAWVRTDRVTDLHIHTWGSPLKYLFRYILSFRHPDSLAALHAWCLTSNFSGPLLVTSTSKYLKLIACSTTLPCICNLHWSGFSRSIKGLCFIDRNVLIILLRAELWHIMVVVNYLQYLQLALHHPHIVLCVFIHNSPSYIHF